MRGGVPTAKPNDQKVDYTGDTVAALVRRCITDAAQNTVRLERDKQDLQNLLYFRGGPDGQWIVWDQNMNAWVPRPYTGIGALPEWVPRATTNRFASKLSGIISLLVSASPALTWKPSTDDDNDLAAAEVAQDATPVLLDEVGWDDLKRDISTLVALTDKIAVVYYWDADPKYGVGQIEMLQCPVCNAVVGPLEVDDAGGACPKCGQQEQELGTALNPDASPVVTEYPIGRLKADLIPSLEFSIPSSARSANADKQPWVLIHSRIPTEECLGLWPDAKDVIKGAAGESGGSRGLQRQFADEMRRLSAPRSSSRDRVGMSVRGLGPVVYRLQHDPINDGEYHFPDGLYAVMIGDKVVEAGPLPLTDDQGRAVKTILIRSFVDGPASPYGKPPADDLVSLQNTRNLVETLILLILMHDAAPRTFVPLSCTLEDEITGQPGQQIRYRSMVAGEHPTTDRGVNPPEGLYKYLEMIDQAMEEISGMNAVLQGQRPQGDPTLGEVEVLREQGQMAFKTALDKQVTFERDQARLLLRIARQSMWSPRFRQVRGENGEWDVQQFSAASLSGNVDVQCDPSSAWPRSPLMQSMRLQKAVELGMLQPANDPELQSKLLEQENLAELKPSLDVDRKQVARELDRWKAASRPEEILPPKPEPLIAIPLHLHLKTLFLRSEEAETLEKENPAVFAAMVQHVMALKQMQQQAQMQQAMMSGAVKPPGPPAAPPPDKRTPVEKGDTSGLEGAIRSGALKPAGVEQAGARAAGGGLDDALNSGALMPAGAVQEPAQGPGAIPPAQGAGGPSIDDVTEQRAHQPLMGG